MKKYRLLLPMLSICSFVHGQVDSSAVTTATVESERTYVQSFRNTQLINIQTAEKLEGFEFKIQHRFGEIIDDKILKDFMGLDLTANIRLSLSYPITKRIDIGIGRTKFGKTVDGDFKFIICKQTEGKGIPFAAAFYANVGLSTDDLPTAPAYSFFANGTDTFKYKFTHRLDYRYELPISRRINDWLSLQLTPIFVYQNLVEVNKDNYTAALNFAGRVQFSNSGAVLFEYGRKFNNRIDGEVDPLSLAVEFGTAGHVFQIVLASSNDLRGQKIYTQPNADYTKGRFHLGFNIKRIWWI